LWTYRRTYILEFQSIRSSFGDDLKRMQTHKEHAHCQENCTTQNITLFIIGTSQAWVQKQSCIEAKVIPALQRPAHSDMRHHIVLYAIINWNNFHMKQNLHLLLREEKSKFSKENNNNTIIIYFQNIAKNTKTVKHYIQVNTNVPQDRTAKI